MTIGPFKIHRLEDGLYWVSYGGKKVGPYHASRDDAIAWVRVQNG